MLGPPKMYKGPQHADRSLYNTMEFEHNNDKDAKVEFTAPAGVTTTAEMEWAVVCAPVGGFVYPERTSMLIVPTYAQHTCAHGVQHVHVVCVCKILFRPPWLHT